MAHFARITETNIVDQVVVISNADLLDENNVEQESLGVAICERIYGGGVWVQTSFNNNLRNEFATPGSFYDAEHDVFRSVEPPFPSWSIGATGLWEAPTPKPASEFVVNWDEDNQVWNECRFVKDVNGVRNFWNVELSQWESWNEEAASLVRSEPQEPNPEG